MTETIHWIVDQGTQDKQGGVGIDESQPYANEKEARAAYAAACKAPRADVELIMLTKHLPGGKEVEIAEEFNNPTFNSRAFDDGWRHERAMEAGMAFGCSAYNDIMGYGEE